MCRIGSVFTLAELASAIQRGTWHDVDRMLHLCIASAMLSVFRRRDTRRQALGVGGVTSLLCLAVGLGSSSWSPLLQPAAAVLAGVVVAALIVWTRRALPRDIDLVWLSVEEQDRLAAAGAPSDRALLSLTLRRDWGRRYRLDVFIDGSHVGQLRPGTGLLLPLRPGLRQMSASLGFLRRKVSETINSLPGTAAGFVIRCRGSRAAMLEIERLPAGQLFMSRHEVRLLRPRVSEA